MMPPMRRLAELLFLSICTALLVWALIRWLPPEPETEANGAGDQVATAVSGDGWIDMGVYFVYGDDDDGDLDLYVVPLGPAPTGKLAYDDDGDLDLFIVPLGAEPTGK